MRPYMIEAIRKFVNKADNIRDVTEGLLVESTINFPREGLDPQVWTMVDGEYKLKPDVKEVIMQYINSYPNEDLYYLIKDLHIVGSICTNLYDEDTDIDVHIIPNESRLPKDKTPEEFQKEVKHWSHRNPVYVGKHPVELFIQFEPEPDMFDDACYDVLTDTWKKGPRIESLDYNPYEVFQDVFSRIREYASKADIDLGELQRDVIDFEVIRSAMQRLPTEYKEKLKDELEEKLQEIEDDIRELIKDREEWVEMRHKSSSPSEEEALSDIELVKRWNDANAIFKFLNRYKYIRIISELKRLLEDDKLSKEEVEIVKSILKTR